MAATAAAAVPELNCMNVAMDIAMPTQCYRSLQGKYRTFIAPAHRKLVENWYNNFSTKAQRHHFKHVVRCVRQAQNSMPLAVSDAQLAQATAVMRYGGQYISTDLRKVVQVWLGRASEADRQSFRESLGRVTPLSLFGGQAHYATTYATQTLDRTAEKVYGRSVSRVKKRLHEARLAQLRGLQVAASEASTPPPGPVAESGVGSEALASSCGGGGAVTALRKRPGPMVSIPVKGTTYETFFNAKPLEAAAPAGLRPGEHRRGAVQRAGPPWGEVEHGFVRGALQSQTAACYARPDPRSFNNYNENYAVMLAAQYQRELRASARRKGPLGGGSTCSNNSNNGSLARPASAEPVAPVVPSREPVCPPRPHSAMCVRSSCSNPEAG